MVKQRRITIEVADSPRDVVVRDENGVLMESVTRVDIIMDAKDVTHAVVHFVMPHVVGKTRTDG